MIANVLRPALGLVAASLLASAVGAQPPVEPKASLELAADRTAYLPGDTVELAGIVEIEDHWHVNSNTPSFDFLIPTELSLDLPEGWPEPAVTYPEHELQTFAFAPDPIAVYDGRVLVRSVLGPVPDLPEGTTVPVEGRLRYQACDDKQCLPPTTATATLTLRIGPDGEPTAGAIFGDGEAAATPTSARAVGTGGVGLPTILALALLGGLILNVMPCVLPVLSLKVFGLVRSAEEGRRHVTMGGLATAAGILVSFWALALAAIVARSAGAAVGWGVQFQQPGFVAFLAVVVILFSLNLWGLFEIELPQVLARTAGASSGEGLAGHFTSGLFATLMATPCSAPFLGTAVGFALVQPPIAILLVFTAIGVGMALPYLLLAAAPGAAKVFPRPGAWMITLKHVMGFLLAAAAVWLFYVLAAQISPERVAFVQLALLGLALCGWALGRAASTGGRRLAQAGILSTSIFAVMLAVGGVGTARAALSDGTGGGIPWETFDEERALREAEDGRLVFVDFTADWCLTCKANEKLVLETDAVREAFSTLDVLPMKADWTNRDDRITEVLARYGRSAVPFYLLYRPAAPPHAFGEVLTPGGVVRVLEESSGGAS